jgi:hypothetical protein
MTIIKGYVLRQDALLRMVERDLIVEKSRRGRASKKMWPQLPHALRRRSVGFASF